MLVLLKTSLNCIQIAQCVCMYSVATSTDQPLSRTSQKLCAGDWSFKSII